MIAFMMFAARMSEMIGFMSSSPRFCNSPMGFLLSRYSVSYTGYRREDPSLDSVFFALIAPFPIKQAPSLRLVLFNQKYVI